MNCSVGETAKGLFRWLSPCALRQSPLGKRLQRAKFWVRGEAHREAALGPRDKVWSSWQMEAECKLGVEERVGERGEECLQRAFWKAEGGDGRNTLFIAQGCTDRPCQWADCECRHPIYACVLWLVQDGLENFATSLKNYALTVKILFARLSTITTVCDS